MNKKSVLFIITSISEYRVFLYNQISALYDITVGYYMKDNTLSNCYFKKIKLPYIKIGPFLFSKNDLNRYCENFDVVIFEPNMHNVSYVLLPFINKKSKFIAWSIGIRASYTRRYNLSKKKDLLDLMIFKIFDQSDALIFYSDHAIKFWEDTKLDKSKIFIAHNTVPVKTNAILEDNLKQNILFIGTLYPQKRIDELLNAYNGIFKKYHDKTPNLLIVGDGPEKSIIEEYLIDENLSDKVILLGSIFNEDKLCEIFKSSLICVSPDQAGLSVLKSMGYGVPFITRKNAVTGGEIFNIEDGINGFLYDNETDLIDILEKTILNRKIFIEMGYNARNYYLKEAYPEKMINGVVKAIEYSLMK